MLIELSVVSLFGSGVTFCCVTSTEGCLFDRISAKVKGRWEVRPSASVFIFNAGRGGFFLFVVRHCCFAGSCIIQTVSVKSVAYREISSIVSATSTTWWIKTTADFKDKCLHCHEQRRARYSRRQHDVRR